MRKKQKGSSFSSSSPQEDMSKPKELPGFYYDEEKKRYFLIKGPNSGSSSSASRKAPSSTPKAPAATVEHQSRTSTISTLLRARELGGNVFPLKNRKCRFEDEFMNVQVSQPQVWRYDKTYKVAETALEVVTVDMDTEEGLTTTAALLTAWASIFCLFAVETDDDYIDYEYKCKPGRIWPPKEESEKCSTSKPPMYLWTPSHAAGVQISSDISSIKSLAKRHSETGSSVDRRTMVTTLGSDGVGGRVYLINFGEPVDYYLRINFSQMTPIVSFNNTIWTSDYSSSKNQAVMGTSSGAALVNLENKAISWVCRTESDVLTQQFDQSGNIVLCGLRNGAILTLDVRENQGGSSTFAKPSLPRHRIPFPPSNKNVGNSSKEWFKISGKIDLPSTTFMPSAVASLVSLQLYDQYFLASSMDGTIKLYDHRLVSRGPVQSYEGHVNSHTRLQLGVDPYERFVVSGGEDNSLRLWNIKSGNLLFEKKVFSSCPISVCCHHIAAQGLGLPLDGNQSSWGSWHGSSEGLFYTRWC